MNKIKQYTLSQVGNNEQYQSFGIRNIDSEIIQKLSEPSRNSFYQIVLIKRGSGSYFVDFATHEIADYSVCFIFPNQISRFSFTDEIEGEIIMFDETIFCSAILANELREYNIDLQKRINFVALADNRKAFTRIEEVVSQINSFDGELNDIHKMQIKFFTKIIIFKIIDASTNGVFSGVKNADLEAYINFRELVDKEFHKNRKVEYYAECLGMTTKKINSLSKQYSNLTALEVIHNRLSLEIKRVFMFEDTPLKELAYSLNFDSQSALNKFIFTKFNATPTELKKSIRDNYEL